MLDVSTEVIQPRLKLLSSEASIDKSLTWSRLDIFLIGICAVAALVLGVVDLTTHSLGTDAAATRLFALTPGTAGMSEDGGNMALYYLLMHGLAVHFGDSRLVLRLPSAVCGALTVPVVAQLGRQFVNRRAGVTAAALFALSLPLVGWEHAARGYTLGTLFVAIGMLAWLKLLKTPSVVNAALYVLFMTLAVYTLLLAWWVVLAQFLVWVWTLWRDRSVPTLHPRDRRLFSLGLAGVLLATAPLSLIAGLTGFSRLVAWRNRVTPARLGQTLMTLTSSQTGGAVAHWLAAAAVLTVVTAGIWGLGVWVAIRERGQAAAPRLDDVFTLVLWLFLPVLAQVTISLAVHPMFQYRYFVLCLPAAAILTALGLERFRHVGVGAYAGALAALLVAHAVFLNFAYR